MRRWGARLVGALDRWRRWRCCRAELHALLRSRRREALTRLALRLEQEQVDRLERALRLVRDEVRRSQEERQ